MIFLFSIPAALSLGMITYQDLRYRAISWYWLLVSAMLLLLTREGMTPPYDFWRDWLYNLGFVFVQLTILLGWFAVRGVRPKEFLQRYMGSGDLLFFPVAAMALPFPEFPLFFTSSLLIALLCGVTIFRNSSIPLAGLQALLIILLLAFENFNIPISLNALYE